MKKKDHEVPQLAEKLLKTFARSENEVALLGDFEEEFLHKLESKGIFKACIWYWLNTIISLPRFISHSFFRNLGLFESYLKIAFRNILKQKAFSIINIMGLAVGMACCLLITLWVFDELSFDRFHKNIDSIYRVEADVDHGGRIFHTFSTPHQFVPLVKETTPEIIAATRCTRFGGIQIKREFKSFFERDVIAADPDFFRVFTFPLIAGDPEAALIDPKSIVISESAAEKYFGEEKNIIGMILSVESKYDFIVTGVIKDIPDNSSISPDIVIPFNFVRDNLARMPTRWVNAVSNYVMVKDGLYPETAGKKITELIRQNGDVETGSTYLLNPVKKIHLHTYTGYDRTMGNVQFVYIFSLIAVIVLSNACINYMSLTKARSTGRIKEIVMRKVAGAFKINLIKQFMFESLLITALGIIIALGIVVIALPEFNSFTGKNIRYNILLSPELILSILSILLLTGLISGSYPALYLSSFSPEKILKHTGSRNGRNSGIRKMLIVVQFVLSLTLIIGTIVVYRQVDYLINRETGYNREALLCIPMRQELKQSYETIKNEFIKKSDVLSVSALNRRPSYIGDYSRDVFWQGKRPDQETTFIFGVVEHDFFETMEIEVINGRSFSKAISGDRTGAFIVNEEAVRQMGIENPVGLDFSIMSIEGEIIGVMKDFHFQPLYEEIKPLVVFLSPNPYWMGNILVRVGGDIDSAIEYIDKVWKNMFPDYSLDYSYLSEDFQRIYRNESRLSTLLKNFTFLSVILATLGLLGLASYTAERRTKEIGIRKVLGASVTGILTLLYRDYLNLLIISILITVPIAYKAADSWLQKFAYRIELNMELFFLTGFIMMLVSLSAVGFLALRAASSDPVKTLKYE